MKTENIKIGEVYNGVEIMYFVGVKNKNSIWRCKCKCGSIIEITSSRVGISQGCRKCGYKLISKNNRISKKMEDNKIKDLIRFCERFNLILNIKKMTINNRQFKIDTNNRWIYTDNGVNVQLDYYKKNKAYESKFDSGYEEYTLAKRSYK